MGCCWSTYTVKEGEKVGLWDKNGHLTVINGPLKVSALSIIHLIFNARNSSGLNLMTVLKIFLTILLLRTST